MPPPDLPFEEIACRNDVKVGTLRKSKSLAKLKDCSDEERLFQKKQHLEEEFKEMEAKIMKGFFQFLNSAARIFYVKVQKKLNLFR